MARGALLSAGLIEQIFAHFRRVSGYFPAVAIWVQEVARVATPTAFGAGLESSAAGGHGLAQHHVDVAGRAAVIGQGNGRIAGGDGPTSSTNSSMAQNESTTLEAMRIIRTVSS